MRWLFRATTILVLLFVITSVASAEVWDKMPTPTRIWWYTAPLAVLVFILARFKPVLGVVAAIVCTFFLNPGSGVWEMNRNLHGAVAREMGTAYMLNASLAIATPLFLGLLGFICHILFRPHEKAMK